MIRFFYTFIFSALAALVFDFGFAIAQGAVSVQPNAIIHPANPGGLITQVLRIDNPGGAPLGIRIYPGDWEYDSSGQISYYPPGTLERSAANWLSFDQDSIQIAASGTGIVNYTVSVPADAEPGTYWAALFAEGADPGAMETQALASFRMRTAHIIYVNVPPTTSGGRITGILGRAPAEASAPYVMQLTYQNESNTVQILEGQIEIRTVDGELVDTITMDRQIALPNGTRTFNLQVYGPVPAGDYLALAVLNYGDTSMDVAGDFVFRLDQPLAAPEFMFDSAAERTRLQQERSSQGQD